MANSEDLTPDAKMRERVGRTVSTYVVAFDSQHRGILVKFAMEDGTDEICHFQIPHMSEIAEHLASVCEKMNWPLAPGRGTAIADGEATKEKVIFVYDHKAMLLENSIILILRTGEKETTSYLFPAGVAHSLFGGMHDALRKGRTRNVATEVPPTSARN